MHHGLIISNDLGPSLYLPGGAFSSSNAAINNLPSCIGCGLSNTDIIVSNLGNATSYAASVAFNLNQNNYTDWYLPSAFELNAVIQNTSNPQIASILNPSLLYWTSNISGGSVATVCSPSICQGYSFNWNMIRVVAFRKF
jgi:hypothetical protein